MTFEELRSKIHDEGRNQTPFYKDFRSVVAEENKLKCVEMLMEHFECGFDEARQVIDLIIDGIYPDDTPQYSSPTYSINTPHCPKCGSTAITAGARGVNYLTGFFGASKTVNRCANCGHTWKPKG